MKVWVLTEEFNDYDQHGAYFLAVFKHEPTEADLKQFDYCCFGRQDRHDYSWVNKEQVDVNEPT